MRRLIYIVYIIVLSVVVGACGKSLQRGWTDFNAYYNTYYNAEKSFRAGMTEAEKQQVEIDTSSVVRVHPPPPLNAGDGEFGAVIEKTARIIRNHQDSKWVDDALLLMGKAYYYRGEFSEARVRFEELLNMNIESEKKVQREAVIWKGRTLIDMRLYAEGVSFLEFYLQNMAEEDFEPEFRSTLMVLAAEHEAMQDNWEETVQMLTQAIPGVANDKLLGRTYFLYGQALEKVGRYGEAFRAYSKVTEHFAGYDYNYWSRLKQGVVAREGGKPAEALEIFQTLRRDDKFNEYRHDLGFEIAHSLEAMGEIQEAEVIYNNILREENSTIQVELRSKIYFRMGKIYTDWHKKYDVAAGYYDSSAAIQPSDKENIREETEELARAYNRYTELHQRVHRADSLLYLGRLNPSDLDSVVALIEQRRRNELLEEEREEREILTNAAVRDENIKDDSSIYGFLNYRSKELVERGRDEFRIVWGERPRVDNWRRNEVITSYAGTRKVTEQQSPADSKQAEVDLGAIPQTPEAFRELEEERLHAHFELGNLMFLTLNMPDSASYYYQKVLNEAPGSSRLRPQAMYSLYELYRSAGRNNSAMVWREKLLQEAPDSKYAIYIREQGEGSNETAESEKSQKAVETLGATAKNIIEASPDDKAVRLRKLALDRRKDPLAGRIHYLAIEEYIREAKAADAAVEAFLHQGLGGDSPNARQDNQFCGARWDSVRSVLREYSKTFPDGDESTKVEILRSEITCAN